ncbi:MAG: hypothetical protein HRU38_26315 [Saccharospirillaceae bacterium]|nr:hypothetical protein [Saccharospirillaceae bacterium]
MLKLSNYPETLKKVIDNLEPSDEGYEVSKEKSKVAINVQAAMVPFGYEITLPQAEQLWSDYSYNNFASWSFGGKTVDDALSAITDLCNDIEHGENHIGL